MRFSDYLRLAWGALWERRSRSIGAIVGIAIAVIALGLALGMGLGFRSMTVSFFERVFGINTVFLIPSGSSQLTMADAFKVSQLPYVSQVEPILSTYATINVNGRNMRVQLMGVTAGELTQLFGVSTLADAVEVGEPALAPGYALVGYYVAYTYTGQEVIYPGQLITLVVDGRTLNVIVAGILKPSGIALAGVNPNNAIFIDEPTYLTQIDPSGIVSGLIVYVDKASRVDQVSNMLQALYPQDEVLNLSTILSSFNQYMMLIELFLGFISGISFVIIGIWMFDTMTISVIQRMREFGIMRAVGFSRWSIPIMLLVEVLVLGLIGSSIGLGVLLAIMHLTHQPATQALTFRGPAAGIFFRPGARAAAGASATSANAASPSFNIPLVLTPPYMALIFILPIVTNIIAALIPAIRASRIPPAQTLRYE